MSSESLRIYYNPRCSKCRDAATLVAEHGYTTELIKYLETPPTEDELRDLLIKLDMKPEELVRKGEAIYKEQYAGQHLSDAEWIQAMLAHPVLIERPIVVRGNKAVVARPADKVLSLI